MLPPAWPALKHVGGWAGRRWFSELPYFWTKVQVLEWISYHVEKNKYDASSIDFSCCNMDGHTLCHCTRDQMRLIFGPLGDELYDRLHEINSSDTSGQCSAYCLGCKIPSSWEDDGILPQHRSRPCRDTVLQGPDVKMRSKIHGKESSKLPPNQTPCCPAAPRGTHLWEFIRDILIHPELNEGLMKWEDRREGVFKFLRSEAVAQLWGQKKKNSSMTYEKLSRAMRYYYKREILERVDGRRLVYKFGKNSSGWKEEEVLNRNKEL
uniref:ETS-related transcription factor Elf-3 n=1 Tax=Nothoprocta perdicaria TaxID=30464 RepID=A0A8C6YX54_NOTPE